MRVADEAGLVVEDEVPDPLGPNSAARVWHPLARHGRCPTTVLAQVIVTWPKLGFVKRS